MTNIEPDDEQEHEPPVADLPSPDTEVIAGEVAPKAGKHTVAAHRFPVVGIGASAGGLAAVESLLSAMPTGTQIGMAFVLVQHLAPDHKSILTSLVKRYTSMDAFEVEDGMMVRPNCIYIIPSNKDIALLNGKLQLLDPVAARGQRHTIDFFFRSLARDVRERAICIVLSGTGSDGTLGVRAIKEEGGMVMVQTPESTIYDGMPRSAIATGLVDYVLTPTEMPAQLLAYVAHRGTTRSRFRSSSGLNTEDMMQKIFVLLRSQTRHDFSQYKPNTITRRVERRMAIHQITQMDDYVRYLQQSTEEVDALFRDLLIGVTSFFRDPDAFAVLQEHVIPQLFADKPPGSSVRVWVPACSTGEESYSIAMLLQEQKEAQRQNIKLQVFASDIDGRALTQARTGVYSASIAADLSPERLARFFSREPDGSSYRINKAIRDILVFSEHDIINDPPFSKLDLVSCRNLLIYMDAELQRKLIRLFHYALKPKGCLFLGTSETVGVLFETFSVLDRKAKLYQRKDNDYAQPTALLRFAPTRLWEGKADLRPAGITSGNSRTLLRDLTEQGLIEQYQAVGVLVNEQGEVLYIHGRTGQYLEQPVGEVSTNILKMARAGLQQPLMTALHQAVNWRERVHYPGLRVKTNGDYTTVDLTIQPVASDVNSSFPSLFLVILEAASGAHTQVAATGAFVPALAEADEGAHDGNTNRDVYIAALMQELRSKDDYLQTVQEELETANEELRSSNEEMQSINEEMQSTNEELETSQEELQSVNEELSMVNTELLNKVTDLSQANNDMNNLLAGTGVGTVFVDHQLHIQRFTPTITQVINLIATDLKRPLGHIVSNLVGYDRLVEDVQAVLDTLIPREIEVQTRAGTWFLLHIRPYRTQENVIEGAVITFTEITASKRAQAALQEAQALRRLAIVVRDAYDAITMQDLIGNILAWNPGAIRLYGWSEAEALAMNIRALIPPGIPEPEQDIVRRLIRAEMLEPIRTQRLTKDGRIVEILLIATALVDEAGQIYAIATTERAIA
jgi:two-component system, chemotaxis family, CheB/CheR fusion protein